jgi:hypothetical protein
MFSMAKIADGAEGAHRVSKLHRAARLFTAPVVALAMAVCGGEETKSGAEPPISAPTGAPSGVNAPDAVAQQPPGPQEGQASTRRPSADKSLATEDSRSVVKTVEIVPPVIHAVLGAKVQIAAIARTAGGAPIAKPGAIAWSTAVPISSTTSNPTIVTASSVGSHPISVTVAGKPAPAATLFVRRANQSGNDKVTVAHSDGSPPTAVLIDANEVSGAGVIQTTAHCQHNDLRYNVAGSVTLNQNLTAGCPVKLAVFSPGHAVHFECHGAASGPNCDYASATLWSNGADSVGRSSLPPPLQVGLVVWYRVSAPDSISTVIAKGDVNYATSIYTDQRAAMQFNILTGQGGANGSVKSLSVSKTATDPCENVETGLDIDAVEGSVNVVYVEGILFNNPPRALTCDRAEGLPPIIVMRFGGKSSATLAHELGHVMGMMKKWFDDFRGGDTYQVAGFDETNLMWVQTNATVGLEPDQISLGQAFRMHVDSRSWVNVQRDGPTGANKLPRIRSGDTETCQPKRTESVPCPVLSLKVGPP